jgi:polyhydroxyalkanoate synthesis regulator phasin
LTIANFFDELLKQSTMNPDNLVQVLQTGFRITVGATASVLESIQDTDKRTENLETLKLEWPQIADKLANKGEKTEQEARQFVDTLLSQQPTPSDSRSASSGTTEPTSDGSANVQSELEELTEQITTLRKELEELRQQEERS